MNNPRQQTTITALRWTVGLVVLWESCRFALSAEAARTLLRMGLPQWIALALGGVEALASILFLLPKMVRFGGYALLAVFAFAALLHLLHGQFEIGALLVYAAAVVACISAGHEGMTGNTA